jgi:hypothetical protein
MFMYNLLMFLGSFIIVVTLSYKYLQHGPGDSLASFTSIKSFILLLYRFSVFDSVFADTCKLIEKILKFCQLMQFLEIMHLVFGCIKSCFQYL